MATAAETALDLPIPPGTEAPTAPAETRADEGGQGDGGGGGGSSLLKSGAMMALGTIASRVTGFLRTAAIVAALSNGTLLGIYNTANTFPNQIYDLLLGGILTSVIVPLLVRAKERDKAYGEQYEQRVFTLAVLGLVALSALAMLAAPLLITLSAPSYHGDERRIAILFALFFLPQILFYGIGAFAGAILNTRGSFGAPMWAPVLNNVVMIAVGGAFLWVSGGATVGASTITDTEFYLLAVGTTGGIVLQTIALWPSLRRVGFRWRPKLNFQKGEISGVGRLAGWTLLYVMLTQAAFTVVTALCNSAGTKAHNAGAGDVYGYGSYSTAYMIFQLPYAIVAVSVITALLPRMSRHASEGASHLVRDDFSAGLRLSSVIILPAAALMAVLGPEISVVLFAHGSTSVSDAEVIGRVMQAFAVALVPFSIYQLMMRVFYAHNDTRTPAFIAFATVGTNVLCAVGAFYLLPPKWIIVGIASGFALANVVGTLVCWVVLRRKLGGLDGRRVIGTHLKLLVALWPLIGFAYAVHAIVTAALGRGLLPGLLALVVGSAGGGVLYLLFARLLRVGEVQSMLTMVASRIPGGRR
ncbi:murein biosynthesis integral membrane protein MurJ [Actinomadura logoneensis]|uniref:Murein biosynthesis integral membrane protein MurJ n=1 Tax=Actinomadura logoneensis TaxID=2293572 RepID=A0A372JUC1_9ACTN|nr:murein biosynthesis integral membrane protein MurJ [Actinomadura logoneensis]RFU43632.1 murein biosynthesis integral membrane protein MurJ [Actinomadura logoneensis]